MDTPLSQESQELLRKFNSREKERYHTDPEYRQRRQLACRKSYQLHAEKKRAAVYARLVRLGCIKKPKLLMRYGLEEAPPELEDAKKEPPTPVEPTERPEHSVGGC